MVLFYFLQAVSGSIKLKKSGTVKVSKKSFVFAFGHDPKVSLVIFMLVLPCVGLWYKVTRGTRSQLPRCQNHTMVHVYQRSKLLETKITSINFNNEQFSNYVLERKHYLNMPLFRIDAHLKAVHLTHFTFFIFQVCNFLKVPDIGK